MKHTGFIAFLIVLAFTAWKLDLSSDCDGKQCSAEDVNLYAVIKADLQHKQQTVSHNTENQNKDNQ